VRFSFPRGGGRYEKHWTSPNPCFLPAYSGEADHHSGMKPIMIPGHADHHRSEATLACFNDQSMIGISQSFPVS